MEKAAASHHSTPLTSYIQDSPSKKKWALSQVINMLADTDAELLKALIDGSLPRKVGIPL